MTHSNPESPIPNPEAAAEYCRQLEAYLCRKNDGHLVRIVGPAFEQVCGWAERGIPLKLATRGIDRYFERYYAKGPRRRPVRVEFCEADVFDVFDEWRRSVGVSLSVSDPLDPPGDSGGAGDSSGADLLARRSSESEVGPGPRHNPSSLPSHLERVIARLTTLRGGEDRSLDGAIDTVVRELDAARAKAKSIRGEAREALLDRLRDLDASLIEVIRARCDAPALQQLTAEADEELRPFRSRMPEEAYRQSQRACVDRLLRERARLPTISYE